MKHLILLLCTTTLFFTSCQNKGSEAVTQDVKTEGSTALSENSDEWTSKYDRIEATEIPQNAIKLISEDWMLVTAGTKESFNSMTANWGALGELWYKHVSMITVRDIRYTYQFLETNDTYTLSFFPEKYRGALNIMGSKSGRDTDKVKEAGLTPITTPAGDISYAEASMIFVCKKMYAAPFQKDAILDQSVIEKVYGEHEQSMHTLYIGEIVDVWVKK